MTTRLTEAMLFGRTNKFRHVTERPGTLTGNLKVGSGAAIKIQLGRLAIDNVTDGLETRTSDGPFIRVKFLSFLVQPKQDDVGSDIKNGIDTGGQERQG
jgi:hypothetical protein